MMTTTEIALVKYSWRQIRNLDPQTVGDLFYTKLFVDHPELRILFPKDMTEQHQKLVGKFNLIISRLDQFEVMLSDMEALAIRHVAYGAKPQHYAYVGAALLWTLERALGTDWTPKTAAAWRCCYDAIASVMLNAAEKNESTQSTRIS